MKKFNRRAVQQLRAERAWTLDDVAKRARLTARTVLYVEKGHVHPKANTVAGIAHAFGVPIDALFADPSKKDTVAA